MNAEFVFSIESGNEDGYFVLTPEGFLSLKPNLGEVETIPPLNVVVKVSDKGVDPGPQSNTYDCSYEITDVNDKPPQPTYPAQDPLEEILVLENSTGQAWLTDFSDTPVILNATDEDVNAAFRTVGFDLDGTSLTYSQSFEFFQIYSNGSIYLKDDIVKWPYYQNAEDQRIFVSKNSSRPEILIHNLRTFRSMQLCTIIPPIVRTGNKLDLT